MNNIRPLRLLLSDITLRNNQFFFSDIFNFCSFFTFTFNFIHRVKLKSYHLGLSHGKVSCRSMDYGTLLILFSFTALVKDLRQNQNNEERVTALADRITNLANRLHKLSFDRSENNAVLIQIHSCSVTLWNIAVAMKTGGTTGAISNARCKIQSASVCLIRFLSIIYTLSIYRKIPKKRNIIIGFPGLFSQIRLMYWLLYILYGLVTVRVGFLKFCFSSKIKYV